MKTDTDIFSTWLNEKMVQADISPFMLSLYANISLGALTGWTTGKNIPKVRGLIKVSDALAEKLDQDPTAIILESLEVLKEYQEAKKKWNRRQRRKDV